MRNFVQFGCLMAMTMMLSLGVLVAERFTPPAEGPVAFRVDRLPLDTPSIADLSAQLVHLAQANRGRTAAERRCAAQTLALAASLEPANAAIRDLIAEFVKTTERKRPARDLIENSRIKIWDYLAWLESPEAGSDGQSLAACLADVMAMADSQHPRSEALREAGEKGAWSGWVPGLTAYEKPAPEQKDDPPPSKPPVTEPSQRLAAAQVKALLWTRDEGRQWRRSVQSVGMTATIREGSSREFSLNFSLGDGEGDRLEAVSANVVSTLAKHHGNLPRGMRVTIHGGELQNSLQSGRPNSISAAALVLASAAVSGREPDAIIVGNITEKGDYILPSEFWPLLRDLQKSPGGGGRVVLPAEATGYLSAILALEDPDFFFKYEVLLADDAAQLLRHAARHPDGEDAQMRASFAEIRDKRGTTPTDLYVANRFIRPRLAEVGSRAPWHASATMLAVQASGNRPTRLPRGLLAREILSAIQPVTQLAESLPVRPDAAYVKRVDEIYNSSRQAVDQLERYTDTRERELLEAARKLTIQTRTYGRTCDRSRGFYYDSKVYTEDYVVGAVTSAHRALRNASRSLLETLNAIPTP
jgi:hypothetical protein